MSLQIISQVLSSTKATYINGVAAERRIAAATLKNVYQGLVEKDGRGVNDKFVTSKDAEESAQVFVHRVLPIKMSPRELGSSKNGASFSANSHYTQTVTVGIELLMVLDDTFIIPRVTQDMIKVDLLAEQVEIYSKRERTIINGATAASKLLAVYLDKADGKSVNEVVISATDVSNGLVLSKFIDANSLLDEGDQEHGIDMFDEDTRVAIFKPSYRSVLKAKGILTLGGANYGYEIAKGSAISEGDSARKTEDGYIGEIDGVPCHIISNESLQHAAQFLGFPANELLRNHWKGYIASSLANARGVSTAEKFKTVPAISGQGVVVQPYTKFGVISWYPKGNVMITDASYDPFGGLKTLFSSVASGITFKLKPAGSRLYPTIAFTAKANSGFTATLAALDDFGTDHVKAAAYVVGTSEYKTVSEFLDAYASASSKGSVTSATPVSLGSDLTSGQYLTVLCISDDGSCSLESYAYAA